MVKNRLYTRSQVTARAADGMRMQVELAKGVVKPGGLSDGSVIVDGLVGGKTGVRKGTGLMG
ncbi:hypothetical protein B0T13DRAFT_465067 [Neurospora crassa]|nr:hypothetical protein B0T13DRAFT_465067 [Neurospora crassa]